MLYLRLVCSWGYAGGENDFWVDTKIIGVNELIMGIFAHGDMLGGIEESLMLGKMEGDGWLKHFKASFKNGVNSYH